MASHILIRRFAALVALAVPMTAAAQTLCTKGETDYFSCKVAGHQLVSVCGMIHDDPVAGDWLQYRSGIPRRLQMVWPPERKGSLEKFEGNVFGRYSVSDLRFQVGDASYGISLSRGGEDNGAGGRTHRDGGVSVARAGKPNVHHACVDPDIARYGRSFEDLNALLFSRRGAPGLR